MQIYMFNCSGIPTCKLFICGIFPLYYMIGSYRLPAMEDTLTITPPCPPRSFLMYSSPSWDPRITAVWIDQEEC